MNNAVNHGQVIGQLIKAPQILIDDYGNNVINIQVGVSSNDGQDYDEIEFDFFPYTNQQVNRMISLKPNRMIMLKYHLDSYGDYNLRAIVDNFTPLESETTQKFREED